MKSKSPSVRKTAALFYLFATDNAGASAVEYALLTFIALALVAAVGLLGDTLTTLFQRIAGAF